MATAILDDPKVDLNRDFHSLFPSTQYDVSHNVPVLDEHERPDGYIGRDELQEVADENNRRIADTGDYSPLVLEHTPDKHEKKPVPPIVGFAGPFKLARLGNPSRWFIVAENWAVEKCRLAEAKAHPRRSVELWFDPETGKPKFIDPIALLGATTPRRSLGLKLAAKNAKDGLRCEAYEMVAPSGSNTDVPEKLDGDPPPTSDAAPSQEELLVNKILSGLEKSDVFVFVRKQMAEQGVAVDDNPPIPGEGDPAADGDPADDDSANDPPPDGDGQPTEDDPMPDDPKKGEPEKNALNGVTLERDQYKALAKKNGDELKLVNDKYAALKAEVDGLKKLNTLADRREKLRKYSEEGYGIDLEEEIKETAEMPEAEFDRYCKAIERHCDRVPIGHQLPGAIASDKYSNGGELTKEDVDKIVAIATRDKLSFDAAKEKFQASKAGK